MKNIIDVYEGLLKGMEDTLDRGEADIEAVYKLGNRLKLYNVVNCSDTSASVLNANNLKKLTKDLPYIDDSIERGIFDSRNKIKMFANWISNINMMDFGYTKFDFMNDNFRDEFGKKLNKKCNQLNLFNGDYTSLFIPSTRASKIYFEVMVYHLTNANKAFKLVFEYK